MKKIGITFVAFFLLHALHQNLVGMDTAGWSNRGSGIFNKVSHWWQGTGRPKTLTAWAKRVFSALEKPTATEQLPTLVSPASTRELLAAFVGSGQTLGLWAEGMDVADLNASGLHGGTKFGNIQNNAIDAYIAQKRQTDRYAHVRRVTVQPGQQVVFVGDLHGSIHSLVRVLLAMRARGMLDDQFRLAAHVFFVALGDVVDRGWYGVECFYTLLLLKAVNPTQVFLVRGNHEDDLICKGGNDQFGPGKPAFWHELETKFSKDAPALQMLFAQLYRLLPLALFMGCNGTYMQCCHGGIEPSYSPAWLLAESVDKVEIIDFENFETINNGLQWGDFVQKPCPQRGAIYMTARSWTCAAALLEAYLSLAADLHQQACAQIQQVPAQHLPSVPYPHGKVAFVMRGHQDIRCPCKVLIGSKRTDVIQKFSGFDPYDGPVDWHLVLPHLFGDLYEYAVPCSVFCPEGLAPVITLTNATDTQGLDYGGYAVVTCAEKREDWTLQVKYLPCSKPNFN